MAISTSAALLIGTALAAGGQAYNTDRTEKKQDAALADSIRNQSKLQREADKKVNDQVAGLEGDTSADEEAGRMESYMDMLRTGRPGMQAGLAPTVGSSAFQLDARDAGEDVAAEARDTASLMSRIDAAGLQRQGEAFGYGNLATDIGLLGRQSSGQAFMDDLRMKGIRRNPWIDAASQVAGGYASAAGAGGGGGNTVTGKGQFSGLTYTAPSTRSGASWLNAYGAGG